MARATVDVSLRADVKDLIQNLEKVQGVTKKEAKAMVREMQRGYKAQVKASKIAADLQVKATKKVGSEAGKTAGHMTDQWQRMATESSSIFGSGAGWLGDLEGTFDIARQSTEKFGNSWMAAGTVATAAIVGGIAAVRAFNDAQMQLIADVAAASDQLEDYVSATALAKMQQFTDFVRDADAAITMLKFGSDDLRGSLEDVKAMQVGMAAAGFPEFLSAVTAKIVDLDGWLQDTGLSWLKVLPQFWIVGGAETAIAGVGTRVQEIGEYAIESAEGMRGLQDQINSDREYDTYLTGLEAKAEKALADQRAKDDRAKDIEDKTAAAAAALVVTLRNAEAKRLQARGVAELNEEIAEEVKLEGEALAALKAADQIRSKAVTSQLDARGKLLESLDKELALIRKSIALNGENATSTEAMAQAQAAYNDKIKEMDQQDVAKQMQDIAANVNLAAQAVSDLANAASTFAGLALDKFSEIADAESARFSILQEHQGEARREEIAALVESGEITQEVADAKLASLERNEERRADMHQNLNKEQRKAARTAFAVSQAAAIAGVMASSASAYMAYLIAFAWSGFGGPALAAGLVGTATAAQLAVIASNKPPQFADGGLVTPDHRLISAQPGEAVVSRRGVAALGGPSGLSELNKGMGSGGSMTANIVIDRRIIGQAVADIVPSSMTRRSGRIAVYGG